ncbi:MAG TPA: hypothetical protein VJR27_02870 [Candidatus Saccharimonadales bacterium]|nr:hypothetical protein [Candidatus Saccharimonadales bacterium]
MSSHEQAGTRITVERRAEFMVGSDSEEALKAAQRKTAVLLGTWRSRFTADTETAPAKIAQKYDDGRIALHSTSPFEVTVRVADNQKITQYEFDGASGEITTAYLARDNNTPLAVDGPDPLTAHAALSRVLFDCDRAEVRG